MISDTIKKHEQRKALREKHKQLEIPTEVIRIQDQYNKQNIKLQHTFNLEIFKKQRCLTISITIITALCAFITGIVGVFIGYWLNSNQLQKQQEIQSKISITQPQSTTSNQKVQDNHNKDTKQSVQEEFSLNTLKKP